ncbi:MAG: lactate utilization protein [Alphaproteobacteria bacterium]|nr:lactate utilization protein [Alphaproteobacteria bacterium]
MSEAREKILRGIRRSLGRGPRLGEERAALQARLASPRPNLIPKRARLPHAEQVVLFQAMAEKLDATVARVSSLAEVPDAVAEYLAARNLPTTIRMSPDPELDAIPWDRRPLLTLHRGRAAPEDLVGLTPAFAGIAETGTLMFASGAARPATINFMPDTHIAVLRSSQVVGDYETAFARLRAAAGREDGLFMPRTVNLVTGPSRTGDIEQTLILGAHGPRRLHVVLVDDEAH